MKKFLAILLTMSIFILVFAGCTTKEASSKSISVCIGPKTETIDPTMNSTSDGGSMLLHAFETLLVKDNKGNLVPGQAKELPTVSDDELVYTFTLRDGLKWSDGSDLTAEDFEYTFKRMADATVAAPYGELIEMIAGFSDAHKEGGNVDDLQVKALDAKTLEIKLAQPTQYFTEVMAFPALSPVKKSVIDKNSDAWATKAESYISNGAFHVTELQPASLIVMTKNPNYWNAANIKLDEIKFVLLEDPNTIYNEYQAGNIILAKDIATNDIAKLKANKDPEFHLDPMQGTYYISLNTKKAPFDNVKVRKALSLALDRDRIANVIMDGTYTPAGTFLPPGVSDAAAGSTFYEESLKRNDGKPFMDIDATNYEANIAEAKKLLKEAGYENGFKADYTFNDAGYHKSVAEAVQAMWEEIGVEIKVATQEWSTFSANRRNGEFEIARNGWINDYDDPTSFLNLLATGNGNNDGKYSNSAYDELLSKASKATSREDRFEFLHKAEELAIKEDFAVLPVAYYSDFYVHKDTLKGFYHTSLGYFVFLESYVG